MGGTLLCTGDGNLWEPIWSSTKSGMGREGGGDTGGHKVVRE